MTDWAPLDWAVGIAAFLTAVGVIVRVGVIPVTRAVNRLVDTVEASPLHAEQLHGLDDRLNALTDEHVTMNAQLEVVCAALRPTNGDQRSLSDRLDAIGEIVAAHVESDDDRFANGDRRLAAIEARLKEKL